MKYVIDFYNIEYGAHIFATPSYSGTEYIECDTIEDLNNYIDTLKDYYGCNFSTSEKIKGIDDQYTHTSNCGALNVYSYEDPIPIVFTKI